MQQWQIPNRRNDYFPGLSKPFQRPRQDTFSAPPHTFRSGGGDNCSLLLHYFRRVKNGCNFVLHPTKYYDFLNFGRQLPDCPFPGCGAALKPYYKLIITASCRNNRQRSTSKINRADTRERHHVGCDAS